MALTDIMNRHRPARRFSIRAMLGQMHGLARQRAALRDLDDHLLRDINITRAQAQKEADRPFWDAPVSFR